METKNRIRNFLKKKTIIKTIVWRIISSATTFLVAWMLTGDPKKGGWIALVEGFIKMIQYWFHEKMWNKYTRKSIRKIKGKI